MLLPTVNASRSPPGHVDEFLHSHLWRQQPRSVDTDLVLDSCVIFGKSLTHSVP